MDIEELIKELSHNPEYSHAIFGNFDKKGGNHFGHGVQELRGNIPNLKKYAESELEYDELFRYEELEPEFIARVHGERIPEGFKLKLIYNDRQGDKRGGSHTDYMLLVPEQSVPLIIPLIKLEPSVMIKVFQNIFPTYDRSDGRLVIDSKNQGIIKYP